MRFQTILPSILALAIASSSSPVAADFASDYAACTTCFRNAIKDIGNCGSLPKASPMDAANSWAMRATDKPCFCALSSDMTWTNQCSTAETCGVDYSTKQATVFSTNKQTFCEGASTNKNSANMVKATAGITIGFAVAVAQTLL
ncbi:MAG: hypothetical protein JOS17DRAFT_847942 [Linnemannia elongata]|nr:MAG: hypothetical protein JOS17DRAFT_847942 [Linnemannia elongata]